MNMAQRIAAFVFAAFLWLIAYAVDTVDRYGEPDPWFPLVSILLGMGLVLWALRPTRE